MLISMTMSLHLVMAMRFVPGCLPESSNTPALNQATCEAGVVSANNAIHLSRYQTGLASNTALCGQVMAALDVHRTESS